MNMDSRAWLSVVCLLCLATVSTNAFLFNVTVQYICKVHPNHVLSVDVIAFDQDNTTGFLYGLNSTDGLMTNCTSTGDATMASPLRVEPQVNTSTNVEITECGMQQDANNYIWRFKIFDSSVTNPAESFGRETTITCSKTLTNINSEVVQTILDINVPRFSVSSNAGAITGPNSFALNADLTLRGVFYLSGRELETALTGAKGVYFKNCFATTSAGFNEQFIDSNGCGISGALYNPVNTFRQVSLNDEGRVIIEAGPVDARLAQGNREINMICDVDICLADNDPNCLDKCQAFTDGASTANTRSTGVRVNTNFVVENRPAQTMFAAQSTSSDSAVPSATVGDSLTVTAIMTPNGISAPASFQGAKGFFFESCVYSTSQSFSNPVQWIDSNGCRVPNTVFTPTEGFTYDASSSVDGSVYVLRTGTIDVGSISGYRIFIRCNNVGVCLTENNDICTKKRCNEAFNGEVRRLGNNGLSYTFSIINPLQSQAIEMNIQTLTGTAVGNNGVVNQGDNLSLRATIIPQGQGLTQAAALNGAKGVFLYNCYETSVDNPTESQKEYFVDRNGCRIPGSRAATSQECVDTTFEPGVPPFEKYCGEFVANGVGITRKLCQIGICTTANNTICSNRCAAGVISNPQAVGIRETGETMELAYTVVAPPDPNDRTAVRAEEMRDLIIALTVVLPVVLIVLVGIVTFFVIRSQMRRNKNY